jgi:hypothetical protein
MAALLNFPPQTKANYGGVDCKNFHVVLSKGTGYIFISINNSSIDKLLDKKAIKKIKDTYKDFQKGRPINRGFKP